MWLVQSCRCPYTARGVLPNWVHHLWVHFNLHMHRPPRCANAAPAAAPHEWYYWQMRLPDRRTHMPSFAGQEKTLEWTVHTAHMRPHSQQVCPVCKSTHVQRAMISAIRCRRVGLHAYTDHMIGMLTDHMTRMLTRHAGHMPAHLPSASRPKGGREGGREGNSHLDQSEPTQGQLRRLRLYTPSTSLGSLRCTSRYRP